MQRLNTLKPGETSCIFYLNLEEKWCNSLQQIGIVKGAEITCLQTSPLGDPTAYLICGAVIALRERDTRRIFVIPKEENM